MIKYCEACSTYLSADKSSKCRVCGSAALITGVPKYEAVAGSSRKRSGSKKGSVGPILFTSIVILIGVFVSFRGDLNLAKQTLGDAVKAIGYTSLLTDNSSVNQDSSTIVSE